MTSDPVFREFALQLSPEGITLHGGQGGGRWTALARIPLDPETIHADLRRLRVKAAQGSRGPVALEVWLPEDQLAIRAIDSGDVQPAAAMIAHAFREVAPGGIADLVFDGPGVAMGGLHVIAAIPRSVLEETIAFLAPAGLQPTGFTLAASPAGLEHTPWFAPPGAEPSVQRWRIGWPWKRFSTASLALGLGALLIAATPAVARLPSPDAPQARETAREAGLEPVLVAQLRASPRPVLRSPMDAIPPSARSSEPAAPAASVAAAPDGSVRVVPARPDVVPPARPMPDVATSVAAIIGAAAPDLSASANALTLSTRPLRRPASVAAEAEAEVEVAALEPSANALTRSDRPRARPAAAATPAPSAPTVTAPPEPQPAAAAPKPSGPPRIPTSASVASAATIENAIPLRQVVLVGVYGKTGNRSALVRLSNGRYQKVRPGDTVEGSEVAAISEDAIRLRRGGRDTVLVIPQ